MRRQGDPPPHADAFVNKPAETRLEGAGASFNINSVQNAHIPAIECRCAGDPHEMGVTQGAALRSKIVELRKGMRELEAFRLDQPGWLPYPLYLRLVEKKVAEALVPALRNAQPGMLARLEGIAEGSGLPLRSLCLLNAMEALLSTVRGRTVPGMPGACSAIGVRRACSRSGQPMVARNFDYVPQSQPFYIMRESRPRDGFRSLEFAVASQAGAIDGINEQGVCITMNYAVMTDEGKPAPLITMRIADALAKCATAAEAAKRIAQQPHWGAGMLMMADPSGDLLCLELSNTRAAVRRPKEGEDMLVFTNVCHCAETREVQVPDSAVFSERVPRALRGRPVLQWHSDRACRLESLMQGRGGLGPDELAAIMADHGPSGTPDGSSPCVHTEYWCTTAALQWFPARRSVRVSYGTACSARYVELAL